MPPERLTEVERMRRHREEMQLAIAEQLPLTTARRVCQERRRQARSRSLSSPAAPLPVPISEPSEPPRYWWQRD